MLNAYGTCSRLIPPHSLYLGLVSRSFGTCWAPSAPKSASRRSPRSGCARQSTQCQETALSIIIFAVQSKRRTSVWFRFRSSKALAAHDGNTVSAFVDTIREMLDCRCRSTESGIWRPRTDHSDALVCISKFESTYAWIRYHTNPSAKESTLTCVSDLKTTIGI